jgi:hypothetical protein
LEIPSALFSPGRFAFAGYIILVYHGILGPRGWWLITLLYVAGEVLHEDFLRKILNTWGDRFADWNWKKKK